MSRLQLRIEGFVAPLLSIVARALRTGLEDIAWFGAGTGRGLLEGEFAKERDDGRVAFSSFMPRWTTLDVSSWRLSIVERSSPSSPWHPAPPRGNAKRIVARPALLCSFQARLELAVLERLSNVATRRKAQASRVVCTQLRRHTNSLELWPAGCVFA